MQDKKYVLDTDENREFLSQSALALLDFGRRFPSPGGGSYYLLDDGTPDIKKNRETWITSRMAHVYSIGAMMQVNGCKALSQKAIEGLRGELKDVKNGGWYAGLTADGKVLSDKQCYAHAFVILAASSAMLAEVPEAEVLFKDAIETYDRYFWDEGEGLSCDTWNTEFTQLDDYRGLNANMHTVEAFLAAADAKEELKDTYRRRAGRIINRVIGWAEANDYRIPEHFTSDWEPNLDKNIDKPDDPFKPYGATPGHGIEWARLIAQWSEAYKPSAAADNGLFKDKDYYQKSACRLYERAVSDAWNSDGGEGLVYTTDWEGKPVVHDRMHWTLAEAINTSAVLYRLTKNERYAADYATFMEYLDKKVLDHSCGSWYHQLDGNGALKDTVWPGKPDIYHAFQAMLIPYLRPDVSIAKAVYDQK